MAAIEDVSTHLTCNC